MLQSATIAASIPHSLRAKLTATFAIVALALLGVAGFAVVELRALEHRIAVEHTTTTLFDHLREVRNRENRLFLFRNSSEFNALLEVIDATADFLGSRGPWPEQAAAATAFGDLSAGIGDYRQRLTTYWRRDRLTRDAADLAEAELRAQRKRLVDVAEALSRDAQESVIAALARHRTTLAASIGLVVLLMVAVANFLARRILRPLASIERQMEQVAEGRIDRVAFGWPDRELVSLARAFNHVMSELEARQASASQAEKLAALGTMLSGVAHELNNPLSNISTSVQIVGEEVEHLSVEEMRRLLNRIDQQTERARRIVRTLLEYARADRERFGRVDARGVAEAAVEAIERSRPVPRPIVVEGPTGLALAANAERLQRALINLIENAIDASDDADPIVVLVGEPAGDHGGVEITVQDCGSGVPPGEQGRVFDPFSTTKPAGQGTGLGLFIVHEIVRQHGGTIALVSVPGVCTSVRIALPRGLPEPVS